MSKSLVEQSLIGVTVVDPMNDQRSFTFSPSGSSETAPFSIDVRRFVGSKPGDSTLKADTLYGSPKRVIGDFQTDNLSLVSLVGGPKIVNGNYDVSYNELKSLTGSPEQVDGKFRCYFNNLTNLVVAPRRCGGFNASNNPLTSLEGAPDEVNGNVRLSATRLVSLHNIHKMFRVINGSILFSPEFTKRHILGLLLIGGLKSVSITKDGAHPLSSVVRPRVINQFVNAVVIFNKYLPNTRGMAAVNECQDELIEADLEDFAEL